jgi:3D (Asp-Asp-Asp) domain-containing protein
MKLKWALPIALGALLLTSGVAVAGDYWHEGRHGHHHSDRWNDDRDGWDRWDDSDGYDDWDDEDSDWDDDEESDDGPDSDDSDEPVVDPGGGTVISGDERSIRAELTGYSYQDNTPPGSADICCPILHQKAGGTGTYNDPITTAVASSSFPPGTRFYVPPIKRYVIVEDSGASDGENHLDIWVGGQGHSRSDSDACMDSFTGTHTIIQNPGPGHPVTSGELTTAGGCKI